ncbi:MAG: hypothetical protein JSV82_08375 [Planctomycetota bacterium]|nr:MAG: hypothetical protein JSV82_08375 [Planctomycetota bacterium]
MMHFLTQIINWINVPLNAAGKFLSIPVCSLPGWLSNTLISAVTGVVLLIIFKYTSNQKAIGRVRDNIKADMLALKLFKDSITVTLQSQGRVFKGAFQLLFHAVKPMLVMIIPVSLLLAQMGTWYQSRPLLPGEETVVTLRFNSDIEGPWPKVDIEPTTAVDVTSGPVRIFSKKEICWKIRALEGGYHRIIVQVGQRQIDKELAIGDGFMRISPERPRWHWADILLYPGEKPFGPDSVVQSISIEYPQRPSRTSGTDWWLGYFFVASLVFALIFKPFLKVRI